MSSSSSSIGVQLCIISAFCPPASCLHHKQSLLHQHSVLQHHIFITSNLCHISILSMSCLLLSKITLMLLLLQITSKIVTVNLLDFYHCHQKRLSLVKFACYFQVQDTSTNVDTVKSKQLYKLRLSTVTTQSG